MGEKLERAEISRRLDITDPFLMIDSFEETEPGKRARATKKLSEKDWFFDCHLPRSRVMPATLQIEGMLQTMVLLIYAAADHGEHRSFVTNVDVRLVAAGIPDQTITYEATLTAFKRGIAKGEVTGSAEGSVVCRGAFTYASPHLMAIPKS